MLSLSGKPDTQKIRCDWCSKKHLHSHGYILDDGETYAEYMMHFHGDHGDSENPIVTVNVIFTYDGEPFPVFVNAMRLTDDNVEFMLWDSGDCEEDGLHYMSRKEGLKHRLIHRNWEITDYLLEEEPHLHKLVYGHKPRM